MCYLTFTWSHLTSFVTTRLLSLKFLICLMNNRGGVELQAYVSIGPDILKPLITGPYCCCCSKPQVGFFPKSCHSFTNRTIWVCPNWSPSPTPRPVRCGQDPGLPSGRPSERGMCRNVQREQGRKDPPPPPVKVWICDSAWKRDPGSFLFILPLRIFPSSRSS